MFCLVRSYYIFSTLVLSYHIQSYPILSYLVLCCAVLQIILCGVESHICVLQTALGLLEAKNENQDKEDTFKYDVFIVADAVSSQT
jgi:nicotinamidase-related amidase